MVDIHCHILPCFDDGSQNMEESLILSKYAVRQGIKTVIATPHHRDGSYSCTYDNVIAAVDELNKQLKQQDIPLTVLPGQEVHLFQDLLIEWESNCLVTLANSNYLLIELPASYLPDYYEYILHELIVLGVTPIIAHPERHAELLNNDEIVKELIDMGVLFQVTSASILGKFGSKLQKKTLKWCKQGWVHFIASDAHNVTNRVFDLKEGYAYIENKLGQTYVEYYKKNASDLVKDLKIQTDISGTKKTMKWWKKF